MLLREAKAILRKNGYRLVEDKEMNEGILAIAGGVALGFIALKGLALAAGVGLGALLAMNEVKLHKLLNRDKAEIGEEIKNLLMQDKEIADKIANKTITKEMISTSIQHELMGNLVTYTEFKNKALDKASRKYNRSVFSTGHGRDVFFEGDLVDQLTDITYDAIMEMKEEI